MMGADECQVTVSVVSHGHQNMIRRLLTDLERCAGRSLSVILTWNLRGEAATALPAFSFPIRQLVNVQPRGFGANHNAAFSHAASPFFCVMNPDIRLSRDPFGPLIEAAKRRDVGAAAPLVLDSAGDVQDSARRYPTPMRIAKRLCMRNTELDYDLSIPVRPEWVAGMFMLFEAEKFRSIGGFDELFYLYLEDADICMRLAEAGAYPYLDPTVAVVHDAQRASHRNLRHLAWHVSGLGRFWVRYAGVALRGLAHRVA